MKKLIMSAIAVAALLAACTNQEMKKQDEPVANKEMTREELVARGEYLVAISGCNDCHTPKKMTDKGPAFDMDYFLAGHPAQIPMPPYDPAVTQGYALFHLAGTAMRGPWGTSFAANLTPDATGLGNWTETQFMNAMRRGWYKGMENSRPILPPMPWEAYKNMTDEDLRAVFAYLKSIPAVKNIVPAPIAP